MCTGGESNQEPLGPIGQAYLLILETFRSVKPRIILSLNGGTSNLLANIKTCSHDKRFFFKSNMLKYVLKFILYIYIHGIRPDLKRELYVVVFSLIPL